jgi:ElaB/YqjD/DUF883 family membrane-anchored ribosome-binding protein
MIMNRYETLSSMRQDAASFAEEARALLEATAESTDKKVAAARKRLMEALEGSQHLYDRAQEQVVRAAKATDQVVHEHPYSSILFGVGIGFVLGALVGNRF